MLRLLKWLLCLGGSAVLVWWGLTVPLGDRTFFGHIQAIGQSRESQELVRGTRKKVGEVTRRLASEGEAARPQEEKKKAAPPPVEGPPQERLTDADRKEMQRLIESRRETMPR